MLACVYKSEACVRILMVLGANPFQLDCLGRGALVSARGARTAARALPPRFGAKGPRGERSPVRCVQQRGPVGGRCCGK
jgi:hypothetical protein